MTSFIFGNLYRDRRVGWISAGLFCLNPGVFQNSVNGMENILLAMLVLLLFACLFVWPLRSKHRLAIVFILAALTSLARPEGTIASIVFGVVFYMQYRNRTEFAPKMAGLLMGGAVGAGTYLILSLLINGSFLPDSAYARYAAGLRESWILGPFHIHSRSVLRFIAYLPIAFGLCFLLALRLRNHVRGNKSHRYSSRDGGIDAALTLVLAMLVFYTFVAAAPHTIRYWIPFWPFAVGLATGTLKNLMNQCVKAFSLRRLLATGVVTLYLGFMVTVYTYEYYLRINQGVGYRHSEIVSAVANRMFFTKTFLKDLGLDECQHEPVRIAMTEVQLRYFLGDEFPLEIISLDGRTSSQFKRFVDSRTGTRRFDLLIEELRPDYIELGQFRADEELFPEVRARLNRCQSEVTMNDKTFVRTPQGLVRVLYNR